MKYVKTTNIFVVTLVFRRITSTEKAIKRFYFSRNISFQNIFLMVFRPQKNNGLGHIWQATGIIHIIKMGLSNTFEIKFKAHSLLVEQIQELWLFIAFIRWPKSISLKIMFKNIEIFKNKWDKTNVNFSSFRNMPLT